MITWVTLTLTDLTPTSDNFCVAAWQHDTLAWRWRDTL